MPSPFEIEAVELAAIKRITGDGQGFALDDQAITVMLDFVQPVFPGRNLCSTRRDAGLASCFPHGV